MKKYKLLNIFKDVNHIQMLPILYNVLNVILNIIYTIMYVNLELIYLFYFVQFIAWMMIHANNVLLVIYYHQINFNVLKLFQIVMNMNNLLPVLNKVM